MGNITFSADQFAVRMAYGEGSGCSGLLLYIGEAFPNQQNREGANVWRIRRVYYDDCDRQTALLYANNSKEFEFSWALRETYAYE